MMEIYTLRVNQISADQQQRLEQQRAQGHYLYLTFDQRQRSRLRTQTKAGIAVGLDLPRTETIKDGSVLSNDAGDMIEVKAAPERLTQVTAPDAFTLMKAAYHLGNRHVPLMILPDSLYFEPDHVLTDMLARMGLQTNLVEAPFEPETGAYQTHHGRSHNHTHSHNHDHSHEQSHNHHPNNQTLKNSATLAQARFKPYLANTDVAHLS